MKMRKKIMVTLMAAVMTVSSAVSVFAAGSRTANVTVSEGFTVAASIQETASFKELKAAEPKVAEAIEAVNKGTADMGSFKEQLTSMLEGITDETAKASLNEVIKAVDGKDFVTGFFDVTADASVEKNANGKYEVTMSVPGITADTKDVQLLHYSTARSLWEVVDPSKVDAEAKTITAEFEDLSPIAIIAKDGSFTADKAVGTSAGTEGTSVWMIWTAMAVVLMGAGAVVIMRKKACR